MELMVLKEIVGHWPLCSSKKLHNFLRFEGYYLKVALTKTMQYIYCFANTSLVLRLMTYLSRQIPLDLMSVTVIYLVDRWIVRIKLSHELLPPLQGNFLSFLTENGYAFTLSARNRDALSCSGLGRIGC